MKNERKKAHSFFGFLLILLLVISGTLFAAEPRSGGSYYAYGEALQKAILFYKAQRSGDLPDNYILPYRADTCMNDGEDVGLDLTGGWFDAGDHVKFGFPMAYTASQLAWGVYEYRSAFEDMGQLDEILDELKWVLDYFIKCHPSANVYYYDCGYGESDHSCWVPPEVVHLFTERTSFKVDTSTPGSDVCGQVAAAMAIGSIIFEPTDSAYAATLLTHAKQLFDFADKYRGKFPLANFYQSGSYIDDLIWGAVWLYIRTDDQAYLDKALSLVNLPAMGGNHTHCWDDVSYGALMKLAQITKDQAMVEKVESNLNWWQPGAGLTYTPGGLAYLSNWGALRYASTAAFLAFVWSDDTTVGTASKKAAYKTFAEKQMNYILGDNPKGGSYEVGFGKNPPQHPHHRTAHCSWISMLDVPLFHRHILYGALVGGPDVNDKPNDIVQDYMLNEVADDYNAGFIGSLAKMYAMYGGDPLTNWPQPGDFRPAEETFTEYFVRGWIQWEGPNDLDILFQLNNRSAWPPTVRDKLSARYFVDLSEVFSAGYTAADVKIKIQSGDAGSSLKGLTQWSGNVYYFTLDFTGTKIHPGHWDLCEKESIVRLTHPVANATSNDWSYQELKTNPDYDAKTFNGKTAYIPIYDDNKLLWGEEPPGGATSQPTPTRTSTRTSTRTPTRTGTRTPTTSGVLLGDVNGSGTVDIVDALMVAQYSVGLTPEGFRTAAADVDGNGTINIVDALRIAQYYVGLIPSL